MMPVKTQTKKDYPRVSYYDHDLVDMYDQTWQLLETHWHKGTPENGFAQRFVTDPESQRINQTEAIFSSFYLVYSTRPGAAAGQLDNFYGKQEEDGAIRGEYLLADGSPLASHDNPHSVQPPLFSWAEFNLYHKLGTKKRLRDTLPMLERYFSWLEQTFRRENGLYAVPRAALMMGNCPRGEVEYPIDFNAQQALNALYMSAIGDILNDKDVAFRYKRAYFSLKTRIQSLMWEEKSGFYYDLDRSGKQIGVRSLAAYWALLAEIPAEDKGERLIDHLSSPDSFGVDHPFPSLAASEPDFDKFGGDYAGAVVPTLNYMVIKGLEKYGRFEMAREVSLRHLYYVLDGLHPDTGERGTLWESYAPQHEGPARIDGGKPTPRAEFLAFAGLSTVALMLENVVGLYISLPRKTVDWTIPVLEIMGVEDLALKRNTVSIVSNKSNRGWEIRLESEKLYYLTINLLGQKRKTLPIPSGKCSILIDKI